MVATRPRLGELLLARGECSRDQLREAWEQKVLYGDRLGTNLLAIGAVDEPTLARALGQQFGVHSGFGRVIAPEARAIRLIPKTLALRRYVVPHHIVDRQLFLMMRDPFDATAIDEAAFASNLRITPVVVCEARIWQLLEVHYQSVVSFRPVPLDGPARPRPVDDVSATDAALPELTSEEEFQRLYASAHGSLPSDGPASSDDVAQPPVTPLPVALPAHTGFDDVDHTEPGMAPPISLQDEFIDVTQPARPIAILAERDPSGHHGVLAPPRSASDPEPADTFDWRDEIEHTQPMLALPRLSLLADDEEQQVATIDLVEVADPAEAFKRQSTLDFHVEVEEVLDESPLSFAEATRVLATATDRNAIARTVLRAARTRFQRACLLTVYPDRFVGWMGIGEGMGGNRMRDVVVSRKDKSVFSLVAESRSHYIGPLARHAIHGAWVKATGRKLPKTIAVFPILVRGRPVNLLVVDNGHDQHVGSDVAEVLILAQQIAKTYEVLLGSSPLA